MAHISDIKQPMMEILDNTVTNGQDDSGSLIEPFLLRQSVTAKTLSASSPDCLRILMTIEGRSNQ